MTRCRDRGAVTAELAVGMVAVALVLLAVLAVAGATVAQVRCTDAARAGARAAALGAADEEVGSVVRRSAGADAHVTVRRADGWVQVEVRASLPGAGLVPALGVSAAAAVPEEP